MKPGIIAIILIALLAIGGLLIVNSNDDDTAEIDSSSQTVNETTDTAAEAGTSPSTTDQAGSSSENTITAETVAMHASEDDCWTIINGVVYDITPYVPRHPGGEEILRACGADGTSLFTQRQTADGETVGSGTPHTDMATSQLASFKVGDLSQ